MSSMYTIVTVLAHPPAAQPLPSPPFGQGGVSFIRQRQGCCYRSHQSTNHLPPPLPVPAPASVPCPTKSTNQKKGRYRSVLWVEWQAYGKGAGREVTADLPNQPMDRFLVFEFFFLFLFFFLYCAPLSIFSDSDPSLIQR